MLDNSKAVTTSLVLLAIIAVVATFFITQPLPVPEQDEPAPPPAEVKKPAPPEAAKTESLRTEDLQVRKYYDRLGFVTLTQGDDLGLKEGEILEVVRDGRTLGNLKVTSVAARAASADVLPNSRIEKLLRAGDTAQKVTLR